MSPETEQLVKRRIRDLGFRMTPQRRLILEAIERVGEHATFDEIFSQVQAINSGISKATLYRTLDIFSRYRLIHGNEIAGGKIYEVVASTPHHHLICHRCWHDQKIEEDTFQDFYEQMNVDYGFLVLTEHMIFMGLCHDCREKYGDVLGQFSYYPKFRSTAH